MKKLVWLILLAFFSFSVSADPKVETSTIDNSVNSKRIINTTTDAVKHITKDLSNSTSKLPPGLDKKDKTPPGWDKGEKKGWDKESKVKSKTSWESFFDGLFYKENQR